MKKGWLLILLTAVLIVAFPVQGFAQQDPVTFGSYRIRYKIVHDPRAANDDYSDDDDDDNDDKNAGYLILDVEESGDDISSGDHLDDYGFTVYDGETEVSSVNKDDMDKYIMKKYHPTKNMPKLNNGTYSKARFIYPISPSDDIKIKPNEGSKIYLQHAQSSDGIFTVQPVLPKGGANK